MRFKSYAQNLEDVILWRVFKDLEFGFYIDVGAHDPNIDSVTKAFYEHGWRGINIEPLKNHYDNLCAQRPEDINLNLAISNQSGIAHYFLIDGLSTLKETIALQHQQQGFPVGQIKIPVMTLTDVCQKYATTAIHFLKVDAEGAEREVFSGMDFQQFRPWVILAEATVPLSQEENYHSWEPLLLNQNYQFVYFDGLNRFYLANEHSELKARFNAPPNIFDNYIRNTEAELQKKLAEMRHLLQNAEQTKLAFDQYKHEIEHSKSWRITKPLRKTVAMIRNLKRSHIQHQPPQILTSSSSLSLANALQDNLNNSVEQIAKTVDTEIAKILQQEGKKHA